MIEPEVMEQRIKELEKRMIDQAITICTISRLLTEAKREIEQLKDRENV
jgi:uncharacterized coiled-coil protein SlyX